MAFAKKSRNSERSNKHSLGVHTRTQNGKRSALGKATLRGRQSLATAIDFETLESRRLMTALSVTDFGANGSDGGDDRTAFQAALNAAKPGDTVAVPAGTFNISGALNVPTGVTISGLGSNSSHVNFGLTNGDHYGFVLNGNDSNVTITGLDLHSSQGVIGMFYGSGYNNIHITNNALQFGGGSTSNGTAIFGIYGSVAFPGLQITHNYFHDSLSSNRNWEIWNASNANLDYNTFYNVADGGHIDNPLDNVSFSYNYGTHIRRMGQEIQGDSASHNLKVVGNTFYDWVNPYYDSFGMSVVNHNAINTLIANNYLGATIAKGSTWGIKDPNINRFGYAIEIGAQSATVQNNTMTGMWCAGVVSSRNALVQNNTEYGSYSWGAYIGEGGLDGGGKETLINNTQGLSMSSAPAAPANTNNYQIGSSTSSGVTTTPVATPVATTDPVGPAAPVTTPTQTTTPVVTANGISNAAVTVLSDTSVKLTWANAGSLTNGLIGIVSTQGRQAFASVAVADNATSATITGLHAGWQLDFEVTGKNASGTAINSAAATAQMTGYGSAVNNTTPTLVSAPVTTPVTTPVTAPVTTPVVTTPTTTTSTDAGASGMTGLTTIVLNDNTVKLSWKTTSTLTSAEVSIISTVGRQTFIPVTVDGDVASITLSNLHAGWQFDFAVVGTLADGTTVHSGSVTTQMTGSSSIAAANSPAAIATTSVTSQAGPVAGSITNVVANVLSDTSVQLSWIATDTDQASAQIGVITTVGREVYPTITVAGGVTTATVTGLHAGWQFDFTITATNAAGKTSVGGPVTAMTTGGAINPMSITARLNAKSVLRAA